MRSGQVCFVPREDVTLADCTAEELAAIQTSRQEFFHPKAATKIMTPYGLEYSPHYLRQSRSRNSGTDT